MNEIRKKSLIEEIRDLEKNLKGKPIGDKEISYYQNVARNIMAYYDIYEYIGCLYYTVNRNRFMFRLQGFNVDYDIEEIIPLYIDYAKKKKKNIKRYQIPLKDNIYMMENYRKRVDMIMNLYLQYKIDPIKEFTKLNLDYILLNSKFDINKVVEKQKCFISDGKITFKHFSLIIQIKRWVKMIDVVDFDLTFYKEVLIHYKNKYKQLDIHEATKYIDECIADYNNSIEQ